MPYPSIPVEDRKCQYCKHLRGESTQYACYHPSKLGKFVERRKETCEFFEVSDWYFTKQKIANKASGIAKKIWDWF